MLIILYIIFILHLYLIFTLQCWETYVGQQIYKLVLLDLVVETSIIVFVQLPRRSVHFTSLKGTPLRSKNITN
jgi:hypothetical protein